jgi:hypothetical protein
MRTTCLLFLTMTWAAGMQGTGYAAPSSCAPPSMKMRAAPWSAVAAATAFHPPPLAHLPYESKVEGGSCCYRSPKWLRHGYSRGSGAAELLANAHDEQGDTGRVSGTIHAHSAVAEPPGSTRPVKHSLDKPKTNLPKPLPNNRQRSLPGNALPQPRSDKFGGAAKGGFIGNGNGNNTSPVRTSSAVRPPVPSLNQARHRSPNPAVVGGSPNLHSSHTAAINGTRMNRKR